MFTRVVKSTNVLFPYKPNAIKEVMQVAIKKIKASHASEGSRALQKELVPIDTVRKGLGKSVRTL